MTFVQVMKELFEHWTWTEMLALLACLIVAVYVIIKALGG